MKIILNKCNILDEYIKHSNINCCTSTKEELFKKKNVVVLGNFDGVHKGHQHLFRIAKDIANKNNLNVIVYTFFEYPEKLENRITTLPEKVELMKKYNIDYIYFDNFCLVKDLLPNEFIEQILLETLNASHIVCGFNYTFGKNKSGNAKDMVEYNSKQIQNNIGVTVVDPISDDMGLTISSTRIREYISNSDLLTARKLLNHNPMILGEVLHGKKIGRELGFPTANLLFEKRVYPQLGTYGVYIEIEGYNSVFHGVMNIGKNPTLKPGEFSVEVHILDFNDDIYGKIIKIEILEKISNEMKFTTVQDLIEKINNDVQRWRIRIDEEFRDTNKNR